MFVTYVYIQFLRVLSEACFFLGMLLRVFKSLFCFLFCIISLLLTRTFSFLHLDGVTFFLYCIRVEDLSSMADKRNGKGKRESIDRLENSCLACLPSLNRTIIDVYLLYEAGLHQSLMNDPILSIIQLVWPSVIRYEIGWNFCFGKKKFTI